MKQLMALVILSLSLQSFANQMPGGSMNGDNSQNNQNNSGTNNGMNSGSDYASNDGYHDGYGNGMGAPVSDSRYGVNGELRMAACSQLYASYESQSRCTQVFTFQYLGEEGYLTRLSMSAPFEGRTVVCTVSVLSYPQDNIRVHIPAPVCY